MKPIQPEDAAFLSLESPTMHMHVGALAVFDSTFAGERSVAALARLVGERIHLAEWLRRRPAQVPMGLGDGVWLEDPNFDLDYHLRARSLPAPGGEEELSRCVGEIVGQKLDLERPLWEMHAIEGLAGGRGALAVKCHHSVLDGEAGAAVLRAFLDAGPEGREISPPVAPWIPDPVPTRAELAVYSLARATQRIEAGARMTQRMLAAFRRAAAEMGGGENGGSSGGFLSPLAPYLAPQTSINGHISAHRRFAFREVPLVDAKIVARAAGATVNHVVMAVVSGALRRLLDGRDERPERSLLALVPVSRRVAAVAAGAAGATAGSGVAGIGGSVATAGSARSSANQVSGAVLSLATHVKRPEERLAAIAGTSRESMARSASLYDEILRWYVRIALPGVSQGLARLVTASKLLSRTRPPFNVIVSNVRGPVLPLWCCGSRMEGLYPIGNIVEGVGLNVTVMSYVDVLGIGMLACRDMVPELEDFADYLVDEWTVLKKAVLDGVR